MIKKKLNSDCEEEIENQRFNKVHISKVPIMLMSDVCRLHGKSEKELTELRECPFDEGGYFIVNGIDRVLIGQERMSTNHVYVFQMRQPNKYAYVAEFRSRVKYPNRQPGPLFVRMLSKTRAKMGILATLSSIREEIPIVIVFRALGVISDKQIIEYICYDFLDTEMTVLLQPSLEEACYIRNQELALEYIGKLGAPASVTEKEESSMYAEDILKMEMLPHVDDSEPFVNDKKAHNFGYIIHRLLLCALNRRDADYRDNFGNKRLDLAGPLLGSLFRMLFSKFTGGVQPLVKKFVDKEKDFKLDAIIAKKEKIITSGLNYSLATGNWSKSNAGDTRTGVSGVKLYNKCLHLVTLEKNKFSYRV
ncbi:hypothetical protein Ddye_019252 [Dipteronia dyeriana]|uniref:DNA-directed RNA polymerase n=1 Tax=Dipteronia dyeriana TaxID=168575 RepID=A0AAD9WVJ3_9ROSI|nr:hypothetical protein Ddye_019252 [Dipteronia dyeriana]